MPPASGRRPRPLGLVLFRRHGRALGGLLGRVGGLLGRAATAAAAVSAAASAVSWAVAAAAPAAADASPAAAAAAAAASAAASMAAWAAAAVAVPASTAAAASRAAWAAASAACAAASATAAAAASPAAPAASAAWAAAAAAASAAAAALAASSDSALRRPARQRLPQRRRPARPRRRPPPRVGRVGRGVCRLGRDGGRGLGFGGARIPRGDGRGSGLFRGGSGPFRRRGPGVGRVVLPRSRPGRGRLHQRRPWRWLPTWRDARSSAVAGWSNTSGGSLQRPFWFPAAPLWDRSVQEHAQCSTLQRHPPHPPLCQVRRKLMGCPRNFSDSGAVGTPLCHSWGSGVRSRAGTPPLRSPLSIASAGEGGPEGERVKRVPRWRGAMPPRRPNPGRSGCGLRDVHVGGGRRDARVQLAAELAPALPEPGGAEAQVQTDGALERERLSCRMPRSCSSR